MSTNLQDITLQSIDDRLVAKNENGHLTSPILFLDREPVPEDAQDFDQVLIFIEGEIRRYGGEVREIEVTLDETNGYRQPIPELAETNKKIIPGTNGILDSTRLEIDGTDVVKKSAFITIGNYTESFVIITLDDKGRATNIVFVEVTLDVTQTVETVTLDETNGYRQPIAALAVENEKEIIGLNSARLQIDGTDIIKNPSFNTTDNYNESFTIVILDDNGYTSRIVLVNVTLNVLQVLKVDQYNTTNGTGTVIATAYHGETLTVTLDGLSNFAKKSLRIYRGITRWDIQGAETSKITLQNTSGYNITTGTGSSDTAYTTLVIGKISNLTVDTDMTTTFRIASLTRYVDVVVNLIPNPTLAFIDPPPGEEGVSAATTAIYPYI